jgi:hypothetical protein
MLRCTHLTKTSRQAAAEILTMATSDKFDGKYLLVGSRFYLAGHKAEKIAVIAVLPN